MALVVTGAGIANISGSIGGTTFARNKSGAYIRNRTVPVNPNTVRQSDIRANMSNVSRKWSDSASAAQRLAWEVFAQNMPQSNRVGQQITLSGFNQFVKSNVAGSNAGLIPYLDAPATFVLPGEDPSLSAAGSEATQNIAITFDDTFEWLDLDNAAMIIQVGIPQNPSVTFFNGPWRHAGIIAGNLASPPTTPASLASPWPIVENQRLFVRARIILDDGRLSDWFRDISAVAA